MHYAQLIAFLEFSFILSCCLLAIIRGGPAERIGALLVIACYVAIEITVVVTWPHFPVYVAFIFDFILAFGLLVVAFRYGSIWLGFAMLLQSANLCSQALAFTGDGLAHRQEIILNNVLSLLMGASIAVGAFLAWRKRRRGASSLAAAALKPASHSPA